MVNFSYKKNSPQKSPVASEEIVMTLCRLSQTKCWSSICSVSKAACLEILCFVGSLLIRLGLLYIGSLALSSCKPASERGPLHRGAHKCPDQLLPF